MSGLQSLQREELDYRGIYLLETAITFLSTSGIPHSLRHVQPVSAMPCITAALLQGWYTQRVSTSCQSPKSPPSNPSKTRRLTKLWSPFSLHETALGMRLLFSHRGYLYLLSIKIWKKWKATSSRPISHACGTRAAMNTDSSSLGATRPIPMEADQRTPHPCAVF